MLAGSLIVIYTAIQPSVTLQMPSSMRSMLLSCSYELVYLDIKDIDVSSVSGLRGGVEV